MKIKEILQRIQSAYSKGVQSDDSRLMNRHIYNKLLTTRALLLSREVNKKRKLSSWNYISLPCVEIIEVPSNEECPCIPDVGCKVYRSRYKLPRPIISLQSHMIRSVTNIDRSIKYAEVTINQSIYAKGGKYSKNTEKYMLFNGYIYIISRYTPLTVSVEMLPEDIVEAYQFTNYCSKDIPKDCNDKIMEREFPIDGYLLEPMIQLTIQELVEGFIRSREDERNDSADNALSGFKIPRQQDEQQ